MHLIWGVEVENTQTIRGLRLIDFALSRSRKFNRSLSRRKTCTVTIFVGRPDSSTFDVTKSTNALDHSSFLIDLNSLLRESARSR